jgi:hypothetical protein
MSALPPKADIGWVCRGVRFVQRVDISPLVRLTRKRDIPDIDKGAN